MSTAYISYKIVSHCFLMFVLVHVCLTWLMLILRVVLALNITV